MWASSSAWTSARAPITVTASPGRKKGLERQPPSGEPKLRAVVDKLAVKFGTVLVMVDQPPRSEPFP